MSYIYNEGVEMIQKVLFLFRASPYASACGCGYSRERALGYLPPPTAAPARWQAEKEQNQKAAVGGKKARLFAGTKNEYIICAISFHGAYINGGSDICNLMDKQ